MKGGDQSAATKTAEEDEPVIPSTSQFQDDESEDEDVFV